MHKFAVLIIVVATGALAFVAGKSLDPGSGEVSPVAATESPIASLQCPTVETSPETPIIIEPEVQQRAAPSACVESFAGMGPVDLLTLPTDFEQTVALYTIAHRADINTLKSYVNDAMGIAVEGERSAALSILFMRYSDLDPQAALDNYYALGLQGNSNIIYPMFSSWAKADLAAAIERVDALPNTADQRTAKRAIMRANASADPAEMEWIARQLGESATTMSPQALAARARTEPQAAMQTALGLNDVQARTTALQWIANTWADRDMDAALAYSTSLSNRQDRNSFRKVVLGKLAQVEPERALKLAVNENSMVKQTVRSQAITTLASSNPPRGLALAMKVKRSNERISLLSQLFHTWAKRDSAAALTALENTTELTPQESASIGIGLVPVMMQADPESGLLWAQRFDEQSQGSLHSYSAWDTAVTSLAQTDPGRAMELASTLSAGQRQDQLVSKLIGVQAATDPQAAIDQLDYLSLGTVRRNAITAIAHQWLRSDPVMTMDWLLSMKPTDRQNALSNMAWQLANMDVDMAVAYTEDLTPQERAMWVPNVSQQLAQVRPGDAVDWLDQFREDENYASWLGQVAQLYVASDPKQALKVLQRIKDPQHLVNAQQQVVATWATMDPSAVGKWWHRLDDEQKNLQVLSALVSSWTRADRDGAKKWSLRIPNVEHRDSALLSVVQSSEMEPADAEKLILDINDGEKRLAAYQRYFWVLANSDQSRAADWVQNARLAPDLKDQLQQQLDQPPPAGDRH